MRAKLSGFVSSCLLALSIVTGHAVVASAAPSIDDKTSGFSAVPASSKADEPDLTRSRFSYQLEVGQSVGDGIFVSNVGTTRLEMNVFAADAVTTEDGAYAVLDPTAMATDVGSWVTFAGGKNSIKLTLNPNEQRTLRFQVSVPSNASPGDHAGGIVVESLSTGDGQIKINRQVSTRLYARVEGELTPNLTITSMASTYTSTFNPFDGDVNVRFTVANTGNISLKALAQAKVTGIFGIQFGDLVPAQISEILPGTKRNFSVKVKGVGQWLFLSSNVVLTPSVEKDAMNPGPMKLVSRSQTSWEIPFTWIVIIVLGGAIFFTIRYTRARRNLQVSRWIAYTQAEAARKAAGQNE